ncbi:hypothetical protein [Streptomyces sp. NPDC050264]|uniref:hypothetical protein n=1 Tax=Streptomyces sp. NPDC050264 TaxID=3155038 RepID=UPI003427A00E
MPQDSWPSASHNNRSVTDGEYEQMAARFSDDGVDGYPTDPAVVSAGAGLAVAIRASVWGSVHGHAWTSGADGDTLTIDPNTSGLVRVDRVVLRLSRTTWTVRAVVKAGVPGAGPPVLTTGDQYASYEVLLANVTIQPNALSVTVARGERYIGSRIRPAISSTLTDPNAQPGDVTWEHDTGKLQLYDGTTKRTIYSDSGDLTVDSPMAAWKITVASSLQAMNGTIFLRLGTWDRVGSMLNAAWDARLPVLIPAAYRHPNRNIYAMCYLTGARIGRLTIYPKNNELAGQVWITQKPDIAVGQSVLPESISWVVS